MNKRWFAIGGAAAVAVLIPIGLASGASPTPKLVPAATSATPGNAGGYVSPVTATSTPSSVPTPPPPPVTTTTVAPAPPVVAPVTTVPVKAPTPPPTVPAAPVAVPGPQPVTPGQTVTVQTCTVSYVIWNTTGAQTILYQGTVTECNAIEAQYTALEGQPSPTDAGWYVGAVQPVQMVTDPTTEQAQ